MLNLLRSFVKVANTRSLATAPSTASTLKLHKASEVQFDSPFAQPREVFIESLESENAEKLGILELHPKIFAATPRMDIIHLNIEWQQKYRFVSFAHAKLRFECRGGGKITELNNKLKQLIYIITI